MAALATIDSDEQNRPSNWR